MTLLMFTRPIVPRPYTPADQPAVLSLLAHTHFLHRHLDWQDQETLLASNDLIAGVGIDNAAIAAFLALSMPVGGISWLRLAALDQGVSRGPALRRLWQGLQPAVVQHNVQRVYALPANEQYQPALSSLGFKPVAQIVLMRLMPAQTPRPDTPPHPYVIRSAEPDDLECILALDHAAFEPLWWFSPQELRAALHMATAFKLAFASDKLIGYAIAHTRGEQGHISRLATHPAQQGMGIGSILLHDVLTGLLSQNMPTITVNTQARNTGSQRLYRRFGFTLTGEQWPIYELLVS
ncbi:GNAT family N-acetyltransferase [Chloroflexota bacterium]